MERLEKYIRHCTKLGFSKSAIADALKKSNVSQEKIDATFRKVDRQRTLNIGLLASFVMVLVFAGLLYPSFSGFVVSSGEQVYSENISYSISENTSVSWQKENSGSLNSLLVSGKIIGNGSAKIYLVANGSRYKLFDSSVLDNRPSGQGITGLVVFDTNITSNEATDQKQNDSEISNESGEVITTAANESVNMTEAEAGIEIIPSQTNNSEIVENITYVASNESSDSEQDANASIESGIVNETVNETINNIPVELNESAAVNETVNVSIDEIINESSNESTLVTGEEVNVSVNITDETNSSAANITEPKTTQYETSFEDICIETCFLPKLNLQDYSLEFLVDSGTVIQIDRLRYLGEEVDVVIDENIIDNASVDVISNETISYVNNTESNASDILILNSTIIGAVKINEPVMWKKTILRNESIVLPKGAFNISIGNESAGVVAGNNTLSLGEYNLKKSIVAEQNTLLAIDRQEKLKASKEFKDSIFKDTLKEVSKKSTGKISQFAKPKIDDSLDSNATLVFDGNNTGNGTVEFEFFTQAPVVDESIIAYNKKQVVVSSDVHYENILSYTEVPETRKEMISLDWITDKGIQRVNNVNYVDVNGNGLIDRIEWVVSHLSNQTYEITISVLNLHSYPMVGAEWTVEFLTTGVSNLTITAENGTVYGQDIEPLRLLCGNTQLNISIDNGVVLYPDYECNETGYFVAKELRQGHHTQKFTFGDAVAYAYNFAGNLPTTVNLHGKLTNSTGGVVNTTVNMTFSLYNVSSGGSSEWTETQNNINVSEGVYTVILGAINPITLNFSSKYWLGIQVNGDSEMTPRVNITNTPNSFNSFYAQEALDLACTDCIGNTEINTTGTFNIDGNLNASNNITLGNSIVDSANFPRITINSTSVVINLG